MNRAKLIDRLVARKMKSQGKAKIFCVCMASANEAARQVMPSRKN